MEKANGQLQKQVETLLANQPAPVETPEVKGTILGKGVKSLRKKLGLTLAEFGKLVGVSVSAVVQWEKKSGKLKLRDTTKAAILAVKGIGKKEAKAKLDGMGKKVSLDGGNSLKNPYLKVSKGKGKKAAAKKAVKKGRK